MGRHSVLGPHEDTGIRVGGIRYLIGMHVGLIPFWPGAPSPGEARVPGGAGLACLPWALPALPSQMPFLLLRF